jgi:hypothetical protein
MIDVGSWLTELSSGHTIATPPGCFGDHQDPLNASLNPFAVSAPAIIESAGEPNPKIATEVLESSDAVADQ